jgi:NTE family protein
VTLADLSPYELLDDKGKDFREATGYLNQGTEIFKSERLTFWQFLGLYRLAKKARPIAKRLLEESGLYTGQLFSKKLIKLVKKQIPQLKDCEDITFEDLNKTGCPPLKIVASDITNRRAAVFSQTEKKHGDSVIKALQASVSYPFLFHPVTLDNNIRLSDGGLCSNLPTFLFGREHESTKYPILAFDLVATVRNVSQNYGLFLFSSDLLNTGLEASDILMTHLAPGVFRIPVHIPSHVTTLKLDLKKDDILMLYNVGYRAASKFLTKFPPLQNAKIAGEKIRKELWAFYGDRKIFEPPLWALAKMVEERTGAQEVRANIMLPTGRPSGSRIVTYCYRFQPDDPDVDLELDKYGGCAGTAAKTRSPSYADLEESKKSPEKWNMTQQQWGKIRTDRKTILSVPIFAFSGDKERKVEDTPIIGILSVDSSTQARDTKWIEEDPLSNEQIIKQSIYKIMTAWSDVIAKLFH